MNAHKTQRGLDELSGRTLKLGVLTRRLLIFIDGQRDRGERQRGRYRSRGDEAACPLIMNRVWALQRD